MSVRLCQLKSLCLFILLLMMGCSSEKGLRSESASSFTSPIKNHWFAQNNHHALHDFSKQALTHHFFDVRSQLTSTDPYTAVIITTPQNSEHSYELDLSSGQRYYNHSFCSQKDVGKNYSGNIHLPPFSLGIIPRWPGPMGIPQEVIILGGEDKFNQFTDHYEHRVRIIGGFVEKVCPQEYCQGQRDWISKIVFIGVDPESKKFQDLVDVVQGQDQFDWAQIKAFWENREGAMILGDLISPRRRVVRLIQRSNAMKYFKKHSIYFSDKKSQKIQSTCHKLYEKLWKEVGEPHAQKIPTGFSKRFSKFIQDYYHETATCQKFVYGGNVNLDREKFWFLSYASIFIRLHKEGYFFDCKNHHWQKNMANNLGKPIYDIQEKIADCKDRDLDLAMRYLPNFLETLKQTQSHYYRFVDYDNGTLGTHQKLYSWVKMKSVKLNCSDDPNDKLKQKIQIIPNDVFWKNREVKDFEDKMKIIQ